MKTAAQRKADERSRRKSAGFVLVQEWIHKDFAAKAKEYLIKLREKSK